MGLLELEKRFTLYQAYHNNPLNFFIHLLCVWPIFFNFLVILYFTPPLFDLSPIGLHNHSLVLNFGFLSALIHALLFVCLDKKAGSLAAVLCFACWVLSCSLANHLGFSLAWKVVLAAQLLCLTGVTIGHGLLEERTPSVLDTISPSAIIEPFLIFLKALVTFFGYEPYPGFHASVKAGMEAEAKEWQENKLKKIS